MTNSNSLFNKSATGVFWSGGAQVVAQVMHLIIRLILARLLVPADFGLVAIAMVVIGFTGWFLDMGFGAALIQRQDLMEAHKSTAFWSNVLIASLIFGCLVALSPLIASFFGAEEIAPVLVALSFSIILSAPEITLTALLQRDFNFQTIAMRQVASVLLGGTTGVLLALNGFGIWALVGDALVRKFTSSLLLLWQSAWRPKFIFSWTAFTDLWSFSGPLIGGRLFNYFSRNLDTILIGRFLDPTSLGIYNIGYQMVLLPLTYVTRPINRVLLSSFSKLQDEPERLRNAYLRSLQMVALITFPVMTMLTLSAPTLLPELLGEKWRPAASLLPLLCLVGLIQSIQNLAPAVLHATGRTPLIFRWHLITLVANIVAFSIGLQRGIMGIAIAYAIVTSSLAPILLSYLFKILNVTWLQFFQALSRVFISTLVMALAWSLLGNVFILFDLGGSQLTMTITQVVISMSIYLLVSWQWNPTVKDTLQQLNIFSWRADKAKSSSV